MPRRHSRSPHFFSRHERRKMKTIAFWILAVALGVILVAVASVKIA